MQEHPQTFALSHNLLQVEAELERFASRRFAIPRFSQDLDTEFQRETVAERIRELTWLGLISLILYNLFLVSDYLIAPDQFLRALLVRLGLVTPVCLLITWRAHRTRRPAVSEAAAGLLCVMICCSVLYLRAGADVWTAIQAEGEYFLILLVMNAVLRVDLRYACVVSALCYLAEMAALFLNVHLTTAQKLTVGGRVFWVAVFTLFANYVMTRERRNAWLLRRRSGLQQSLLSEANAVLVSMSETDRLTGLANRHAYEDRLVRMWNDAADLETHLSAVMVDVDHFKSINDDFGHGYGDRVLQRVATLLQQGMRAEDDFVARIGGEEFIVLLPGSDAAGAALVAERIRTLVQVAGSPAFNRNDPIPAAKARWSTVSCGVATTVPTRSTDPQTLIDAADSALYRAKQSGRNRVCLAQQKDRGENRISENRISIVRHAS